MQALGFAVIALLAVLGTLFFNLERARPFALQALFAASFLMSFLCWAAAGKFIPFTGLLQGGLFLSVPLIFGAMAGVLSERSGVINIAIEGQLLAGAFISGVIASLTQNKVAGTISCTNCRRFALAWLLGNLCNQVWNRSSGSWFRSQRSCHWINRLPL